MDLRICHLFADYSIQGNWFAGVRLKRLRWIKMAKMAQVARNG